MKSGFVACVCAFGMSLVVASGASAAPIPALVLKGERLGLLLQAQFSPGGPLSPSAPPAAGGANSSRIGGAAPRNNRVTTRRDMQPSRAVSGPTTNSAAINNRLSTSNQPQPLAPSAASAPMPAPTPPKPTAPKPSKPGVPGSVPRAAQLKWFWERVSRSILAMSPNRLDTVADVLASPPEDAALRAPSRDALMTIAKNHQDVILVSTENTNVSPAFVISIIAVESGGKPDARSPAGAEGLMQLMPFTAERFGVKNSADPIQNIEGGVRYLDWLMEEFGNDPLLVSAAYNAGENAVRSYHGIPPFSETEDYVPKVMLAWIVARTLCATPPKTASDRCRFDFDRPVPAEAPEETQAEPAEPIEAGMVDGDAPSVPSDADATGSRPEVVVEQPSDQAPVWLSPAEMFSPAEGEGVMESDTPSSLDPRQTELDREP